MTPGSLTAGHPSAWHTAGGDNSRRGLSQASGSLQGRCERKLPAQGVVQASAVFSTEGVGFVADMSGSVQAFSPSGELLWRINVPGGISASPAVYPGQPLVFVGSHNGAVYALDTATGEARWRKYLRSRTDPRILSDLLVLEEPQRVVLSSWGGAFLALDAQTGEEQFRWDAGLHARSAASADARANIYTLRAVRGKGVEFVQVSKTGSEHVLLTEPEDERGANRSLVAAPPVLDETRGVAYLVLNRSGGGNLVAWSLSAGKEAWRTKVPAQVEAVPTVLADGTVIIADLAGVIRYFNKDGEPGFVYETSSDYLLAGGVADLDGTFLIGDPSGRVHSVDRKGNGHVICELSRSIQARPSFSPRGELYVPSSEKGVHVFGRSS